MFILRLFAVVLLALAAIAVGIAFVGVMRTGYWQSIAAGTLWYNLHAASLTAIQAFIQRELHPALWDPIMTWILRQPAWAVTGVPGLLLLWLDIAMNLNQPRNPRRKPKLRTAV